MEKKPEKIPLLLFSTSDMKRMGQRLRGIGEFLVKLRPGMRHELDAVDIEIEPYQYAAGAFVSALIYGLIGAMLLYALVRVAAEDLTDVAGIIAFLALVAIIMLVYFLHTFYPGIIEKKIIQKEKKDLLFALREIVMSTESGVNLFDSMKNVARGNYGHISEDFEKVVKMIEAGHMEKEALKQLAIENENAYLRRAAWQIITSLQTGTRIGTALRALTDLLEREIYREIRDYSANVSFLTLIYMLVAAAVPSIGVTFIIILASVGGIALNTTMLVMIIAPVFAVELMIISYTGSTRPEIFGA